MMNWIAIIAMLGLPMFAGFSTEDLRLNYPEAIHQKEICSQIINELEEKELSAVHQAYLGGYQTIWANHVFNPIQKLKTFNKGKKNIDEAVRKDPKNIDIRFVRLSVQLNCPKFLGYDEHIKEDKQFIKDHSHKISSVKLKEMCQDLITKGN